MVINWCEESGVERSLPPRGHLTVLAYIFWLSPLGAGCYWHLTGRPEMLPNILQCTSQSPTTKNYFTQNVNIAHIVKPENPSPQLILFPCTLIFLVNLVMELIRPLSSIYFSCVFKWKMPLKQDVFVLSCFSTQLLACPVFNLSFFFKVA